MNTLFTKESMPSDALASALLNEADEAKRASMAKRAANLARLSQGLLEGEELTAFIAEGFAQLEQA